VKILWPPVLSTASVLADVVIATKIPVRFSTLLRQLGRLIVPSTLLAFSVGIRR
jgi:hypothetical protein